MPAIRHCKEKRRAFLQSRYDLYLPAITFDDLLIDVDEMNLQKTIFIQISLFICEGIRMDYIFYIEFKYMMICFLFHISMIY